MKAITHGVFARLVFISLLLCSFPLQSLQAQTSEFDSHFQYSANRHLWGLLPDDDWRLWRSQCWVESRLDPEAVSPAGASGICQLMHSAAQDAELDWIDRYNARKNIMAGAKILRRNIRAWWPRPTRWDRWRVGAASYNSGMGHVLRWQRDCGGAMLWEDILPCVTFPETRDYVHKIEAQYCRFIQ